MWPRESLKRSVGVIEGGYLRLTIHTQERGASRQSKSKASRRDSMEKRRRELRQKLVDHKRLRSKSGGSGMPESLLSAVAAENAKNAPNEVVTND